MKAIKTFFTGIFSALSAWLGILAIPVSLLVLANIIDYCTGLAAAPYRNQKVSSYKGLRGIVKKVSMWLIVAVGAILDMLLAYAADQAGITVPFGFAIASIVAIWLICNEIISILENVADIGVALPPFLMKIVKYIKTQAEDKASAALPELPTESADKTE